MANSVPKSIKASLYIDGKPAEASLKNVEQVTRTLERELKGLTIGTEAWNAKMRQLSENKKYLQDIRQEMNGVSGAFGKMKAELGKVGMLAAGYLGFDFVTSQFQSLIAGNAKLSDSLADIRRVTGLTEAGVLDLDASLGKLDTRTSKGGLRDIAVIAGKLGVAKNDILGFVEATDKLVVALGDELGDADQITTQLGKILNVFEGNVTGDNITKLGNAMVGLANDGVASAGFIAQYTQMVSGIAKTAGLSLPATLALGAGLEELGGRAESSATATQNLLMSISSNKEAYKIAGVSLKEFNNLMATAPEQALLKYSKGLSANKGAFNEVTAALKENGEEGVRTIELITKLGQNTDFFNKKISETGKLYQETGQINEAFALKNQTLGAQVEKLGKEFNSISQSKKLVNFLSSVIVLTSELIGWIKRNSDMLSSFAKVITIGAGAWAGYRAAAMLATAWTNASAVAMAVGRSATLLFALAKATLTGNTLRAAAAQRLLGIATMATPWGAILAVIGGLATAYMMYSGELTNAARIQKDFNDVKGTAGKNLVNEKEQVRQLTSVINDETVSRDKKLIAVNKLRDIMPSYLKGYTDEQIMAGKATDKIDEYIKALERKTLAEAANEKIREIQNENIDLKDSDLSDNATFGDKALGFILDRAGTPGAGSTLVAGAGAKNKKDKIASNNARIKEIQNQYKDVIFEQLVTPTETPVVGGTGGGTGGGGKETEADKKAKKAKDEAKKLKDDLKRIADEVYKQSLDTIDKEVFAIETKYRDLKERAKGNSDAILEIERLEGAEMTALIKKVTDEAEKESEDLAKKKSELQDQIFVSVGDSYDQEIAQTKKKYKDLIEEAKKYGFDITALVAAREAAIQAITDKRDGKKTPKEIEEEKKKLEQDKNDFIVDSARQASDTIFEISANNRRAESDARIRSLENERNTELANKNLTEQQREAINAKYNEKVRQEKLKAWKADQAAALAQVVINGAIAVTKVMAQTGIVSPFLIPAIIAGAALQSAVILSQKPPQFAQGGFSNSEPAGYVSNTTLFNRSASGRPFVAGEAGKEWIAPNWMVTSPRFANIIGALESARQDKRMFASGGYNGSSQSTTASSTQPSGLEMMIGQLITEQREFVKEQQRFNSLPIINDYNKKEDYERKLEYYRNSQTA